MMFIYSSSCIPHPSLENILKACTSRVHLNFFSSFLWYRSFLVRSGSKINLTRSTILPLHLDNLLEFFIYLIIFVKNRKEKVSVWLGLSGLLTRKRMLLQEKNKCQLELSEGTCFSNFWLPSCLILPTLNYLGKHCEPHQHLPERDWPKERAAEVRFQQKIFLLFGIQCTTHRSPVLRIRISFQWGQWIGYRSRKAKISLQKTEKKLEGIREVFKDIFVTFFEKENRFLINYYQSKCLFIILHIGYIIYNEIYDICFHIN